MVHPGSSLESQFSCELQKPFAILMLCHILLLSLKVAHLEISWLGQTRQGYQDGSVVITAIHGITSIVQMYLQDIIPDIFQYEN